MSQRINKFASERSLVIIVFPQAYLRKYPHVLEVGSSPSNTEFPEYNKRRSHYSFGLGKRFNDFAFGLGKRTQDHYSYELGKRLQDYSFGLGKRSKPFGFGLGKRFPQYEFGLGKRGRPFGFGLGKRSQDEEDGNNVRPIRSDSSDKLRKYSFGLGKRSVTDVTAEEESSVGNRVDDNYQPEENSGDYVELLHNRLTDITSNDYNDDHIIETSPDEDLSNGQRDNNYYSTFDKREQTFTGNNDMYFPKSFPNHYSFGLDKRSYSLGFGKQPYSFGLGKRPSNSYNFGIGKRSTRLYGNKLHLSKLLDPSQYKYNYPLKFGRRSYDFGIGKRSVDLRELEEQNELPHDDESELGKRANFKNMNFGLGKR